ncbi:hypothetical protein MNBD_GAMMA10-2339 [hydrothermal vent metagenome]|uniref:NACHT domain-containing protein n=1 Tax=hydrothermal vent metagenome TaxID=652676 RepID=A0A3B0Y803_9ZZZZ
MSQTNYSRYKYTPDEMSESEFLYRFVVRNEEFNEIFEDIKRVDYSVPNQHYIIIGQRGQGKTTLLRKIMIEVIKDYELSKFLIPVKFSEEQYQIRSLCRLWEEVVAYLEDMYEDEFEGVLGSMEAHFEDADYDLQCFSYLESVLKSKNKKLLLLVDNIDDILVRLKDKEQRRLREILQTSSSFIIIGGSGKMLEQHFDYGKPFYEFFKTLRLRGLNREESIRFLSVIGKGRQRDAVQTIIQNSPERIESLRQLTGGVPRTLVMLFDIFVDEGGNAFEDLLKILDESTPLYKHRMDALPPVLQDIVHTLAINWDGMYTREISKKVRLESKVVSAQLKQLEKYEFVESESTGKNKIYKIQERFFNIWYLMRFGRKKDRQRVEWLVKFLVSWYNKDELQVKANQFIEIIKKGGVQPSYVYHMCEAYGYTELDMATKHEVKEIAKEYLFNVDSDFLEEVSISDVEVLRNAGELVRDNKTKNAIKYLEKSKISNKDIQFHIANIYLYLKKYTYAEEYYLKAIESGDKRASVILPLLYFGLAKDLEKSGYSASKCYKLEKGYYSAKTLSLVLLWADKFSESYDLFYEWMNYSDEVVSQSDMILYLNLLMAKKQLYKAKELMELPEYSLKDKLKPVWYALMTLMQDEFPDELKKMGDELTESVNEVLIHIDELSEKYTIK